MIISENFPYDNEFFSIFEALCKIPHGSGNTENIARFCADFARKNGCEAVIDQVGNVIIRKPAGKDYENSTPVIIQGHLDMVCEKTPESNHDFIRDPLNLKYDGKYIYAENTTLGGDDGIAVAYALALIKEETPIPPLEILLTSDEETGLNGAFGLDGSMLTGKRLINLDSEEEGVMLCGCAGGLTAKVTAEMPEFNADGIAVKIKLSGLAGGHSGVEIHKNRLNAAKAMARLLASAGTELRLVSFDGGSKNNAIPCNCIAEVFVTDKNADNFINNIKAEFEIIKCKIANTDDKPVLEISRTVSHGLALSVNDSIKVLEYLCNVPDGVIKTGDTGVITSLNTGISTYKKGIFYSEALIRSMENNDLNIIAEKVRDTAAKFEFCFDGTDRYPAWEYRKASPLRERMIAIYEKMYGKKPVTGTIHAGLECGIISDKIAGMDAVSIGPDILDVHTVNERLDAESAVRVWQYLLELLKSMK